MKTVWFAIACFSVVATVLLHGCAGSSVTVAPEFARPELQGRGLKREQVRFASVTDGRQNPSKEIGMVRVGLGNKRVPYYMEGSLPDVVRTMLDTLIVVPGRRDRYVPVGVSIDLFEVGENIGFLSEEGYFACSLRFTYPVSPDSLLSRLLCSKQTTRGLDATDGIESLIYGGVADCARTFVEGTLDEIGGYEVRADSVHSMEMVTVSSASATKNMSTGAEPHPVTPGMRVRVRIPDGSRPKGSDGELELRGMVVRVSADTLVLAVPPALGELAIPPSSVTSLAKSQGMSSRLTSAVRGVPNYALLGGILGAVATVGDEGGFEWETVGTWAASSVLLGLALDAIWPQERWRDLPALPTLFVARTLGDDRTVVAVRARVRF